MRASFPAALAALAFCAAPIVSGAPARAADNPGWTNPFCSGEVVVAPMAGDTYALELFANGKTDVTAKVTLITDTDAYSVDIPKTDLLRQGGTDRYYIEPVVVGFDTPVKVNYAYVDSIGVDGAALAACPTVVFPIAASEGEEEHRFEFPPISSAQKPAIAKYLQALPALPCGKTYIEPGGPRDYSGAFLGSGYGNRALTTQVRLFIDSNGVPLGAEVVKSSGVEGFDNVALGVAEHTRYQPAKFLCTPVVSEIYENMGQTP